MVVWEEIGLCCSVYDYSGRWWKTPRPRRCRLWLDILSLLRRQYHIIISPLTSSQPIHSCRLQHSKRGALREHRWRNMPVQCWQWACCAYCCKFQDITRIQTLLATDLCICKLVATWCHKLWSFRFNHAHDLLEKRGCFLEGICRKKVMEEYPGLELSSKLWNSAPALIRLNWAFDPWAGGAEAAAAAIILPISDSMSASELYNRAPWTHSLNLSAASLICSAVARPLHRFRWSQSVYHITARKRKLKAICFGCWSIGSVVWDLSK